MTKARARLLYDYSFHLSNLNHSLKELIQLLTFLFEFMFFPFFPQTLQNKCQVSSWHMKYEPIFPLLDCILTQPKSYNLHSHCKGSTLYLLASCHFWVESGNAHRTNPWTKDHQMSLYLSNLFYSIANELLSCINHRSKCHYQEFDHHSSIYHK